MIKEKFKENCFLNYPAKDFTTYRVGGDIEFFVFPSNYEDLRWLLLYCKENNISFFVLGQGSNVLISDKGIKGVVAGTKKINKIEISENIIKIQAGAKWDDFVRISIENGLKGLEKTSGIPGSIGGAIFMNAGAFGQEAFDRLVSFEVMDTNGNISTLKKTDVKHSYRKVEGINGLIILSGTFEFEKEDNKTLMHVREKVLKERFEKQPMDLPSAGSVFKRPKGDFASRLIDACGLKGLTIGGAQVSTKHAGFIINLGNATASDIYELIQKVRAEVQIKTGVELELEQILLGEF